MRILYLDWPCFGKVDTQSTIEQMGHTLIPFFHADYQKRHSPAFSSAFNAFVSNEPFDCCFSFNYFPIVSECCLQHDLKYIAVVYDSPYVMLYSYTLANPNNYVFLFDKCEYLTLKNGGLNSVYYSTLPVNGDRIKQLLTKTCDKSRLSADVSFVGSLYNEDHNFFDRLSDISDYSRGYLEGIMDAQLKVQGYNFIEDVLSPNIVGEMQKSAPYTPDASSAESPKYVYANYFINRKITSMERQKLLTAVAARCALRIYTLNPNAIIPNARNMGAVDYYSEMPYVFANSKINLNISLRSIQSGIPLRAMDIMGAGGFLLTNFQADFLDYFVPNEDFVYYESENDLLAKVEYYLAHERERSEIAQNGHEKVKKNHSFENFFSYIFSVVFPEL